MTVSSTCLPFQVHRWRAGSSTSSPRTMTARPGLVALARQLAAADQGADALDQQALRERLPDVVVGAHAQAEQLVDLVVLRGQEDHRDRALPAQLAQQLHAVHARHLDVEHREIDRLRGQSPSAPRRRRCSSARQSLRPRAPSTPKSGCCGRRRRERSYWSRARPPRSPPRRSMPCRARLEQIRLALKYGGTTANKGAGGWFRKPASSPPLPANRGNFLRKDALAFARCRYRMTNR